MFWGEQPAGVGNGFPPVSRSRREQQEVMVRSARPALLRVGTEPDGSRVGIGTTKEWATQEISRRFVSKRLNVETMNPRSGAS